MRAIVLLPLILLLVTPAFAAGFGVYGTGGGGKVDMMRIKSDGDYNVIYSMKNVFYGGGVFLESGGDESSAFQNRLAFGAEGVSTFGGECEYRRLMRVSLNNVFTFRVAGNEKYRFWIGPLIGLHFLTGLHSTTRNEVWSKNKKNNITMLSLLGSSTTFAYGLYYLHYETVWHRRLGFFIPLGLALGVNVGLSESVRIALEAGFRCGPYYLGKGGFNYEGYGNFGFIFGAR
ncbi:MAG: hypothetical protein JW838_12785 [Spirochaetes bacterium]|nr:hypothetical protein [Spirochaetota bacterium]